ncbi:GMC oxidoreductase [Phytohabitans kaempferiae]|uniref:GMC oxidoreductase n=1 Tax=Phytohabitans kaempferiae TaxID=1620943 RepID=A0ABV6MG74_9ACTN
MGCTFARLLVDAGIDVTMIEAGGRQSGEFGGHLRNETIYQHNSDTFTDVIRSNAVRISVPPAAGSGKDSHTNPDQNPATNLGASRVARAVGGMGIFWACATPRTHPVVESIPFVGSDELSRLYAVAENLLHTTTDAYEMSAQGRVITEKLNETGYDVRRLPLAVERLSVDPPRVHWSGPEIILKGGDHRGTSVADDPRFTLVPEHLCTGLVHSGGRVTGAAVRDLSTGAERTLVADVYVVAGGSVLTPQLLWTSGIRPDALGRYLCEQTMATCQVALSDDLAQRLDPGAPAVEPYLWIPVSPGRPWHAQLHRGVFGYAAVPDGVDRRTVTDLVWFSTCDVRRDNAVTFSDRVADPYGLPQPTFHFRPSAADRARADDMVTDMTKAATALGKFLPGAEPAFLEAGFALHITGTARMGAEPAESVVDPYSKVWGLDNLYLGGGGVIPTGVACNTTLTSMALAVRAAESIAAG